jgi:hypothetical protein
MIQLCRFHVQETVMNSRPMTNMHQTEAPWAGRLAPRRAATLPAEAAARWLLVGDGRVWATRTDVATQAEDHWLGAGESLALPPGSRWVLEGWPQASFSLVQQPPAQARQ